MASIPTPTSQQVDGAPEAEPRGKRERRKDARPGELLDAALDLFVEKGFAATRVEEVAARAGVSKGTLFLYFPSKLDLFNAVVQENIAGRFGEWNAIFDSYQGSTADLLRECMRQWWERVGNTRASGITKLVMSESGSFPEIALFYQQEVILPGNALVRRILQRGVDSGEFRAIDLDYAIPGVIAPMIFMVMWKHCLASSCNQIDAIDPEKFLQLQADTLLNGMLQPKAEPQ